MKLKPAARLFPKISFEMNELGCWIYTGGKASNGYGVIDVNGKSTLVHRFSFELFVETIPSGMEVLHKCDVRLCVNPKHLMLGSAQDNSSDMVKKGRNRVAKRPRRLVTEMELADILSSARVESRYSIAKRLGRHQNHIAHIVSGRLHANKLPSLSIT
jgi:HNH endonuclease